MKRNQVRKARRGKNPAQFAKGGFNLQAHVPSRYPEFPRQFQFSSRWTQTALVDLGATSYTRRVGLFDFLNQIPEYAVEMFGLYRYCRIVGVDVHLEVIGQDSDTNDSSSIEAAMARLPFDQSTSRSPQELRVIRGAKYGMLGTAGQNRLNLRHHFGSIDELGNPVYSREYWQNVTEASNTTPPDPSRPVVDITVGSTVGQRAEASISLTVTYHMQWFELEWNRFPQLVLIDEPDRERFRVLDDSQATSQHCKPDKPAKLPSLNKRK